MTGKSTKGGVLIFAQAGPLSVNCNEVIFTLTVLHAYPGCRRLFLFGVWPRSRFIDTHISLFRGSSKRDKND